MDDDLESMLKEGVVACSRLIRRVLEPIRKNKENDRSVRKVGTRCTVIRLGRCSDDRLSN
jgi:hypothetical protein